MLPESAKNDYLDVLTATEIYKPLLTQIATGMGFTAQVTNEILGEVITKARLYNNIFRDSNSARVWLCRLVVKQSIFKISSELFNGQNGIPVNALALTYHPVDRSIFVLKQGQMPLSFWVSYLLHNKIGLAEGEIADILNTNLLTARERLHKARQFLSRE